MPLMVWAIFDRSNLRRLSKGAARLFFSAAARSAALAAMISSLRRSRAAAIAARALFFVSVFTADKPIEADLAAIAVSKILILISH